MRVVNFPDAQNSLKNVIDQVIDDADYTVIVRQDAPDAVMMSLDTFNGFDGDLPSAQIARQCGPPGPFHRAVPPESGHGTGYGRCQLKKSCSD